MLYSVSAVFSKLGSAQPFLSVKFCIFYGIVLFLLALYTVCWQQILKHLPLTAAYANKAVTVVWGIIWGMLIFGEELTPGKTIGAVFVICGIILFATSDRKDKGKEEAAKDE